MNDYEKQFEQIAAGLNIDDRPSAEHKQALRKQMLDACNNGASDKTAPRIQPVWRKIMKSNITKSAAAAIILVGAFIFLTQGNGISTAFADVMEKLAATKTAAFDLTIEFGEQEPQTSVFLYDSNGYIRQNMANGTVNIVNYNEMKVLSLEPETMTAVLRDVKNESFHSALYEIFINFQVMVDEAIALGNEEVLSLSSTLIDNRDAYGFQIDTVGEIPGLFWQGKGTLTIWADTETEFPIQVQWYSNMTNTTVTVSNIHLNQYIDPAQFKMEIPEGYNLPAPEEPTLLTTEPNEMATQDWALIELQEPNSIVIEELLNGLSNDEKILINFFHSWPVLAKGKFPTSLTTDATKDIDPDGEIAFKQKLWSYSLSFNFDLDHIMKDDQWKSSIDPNDYTAEEKELLKGKRGRYYEDLQAALNQYLERIKPCFSDIFGGFELVYKMPAKSDWHYNGAGVELGDAETAIFWYLPEGSENYRVIFGDLTIEDMTPEDVLLLETPSSEEADENAKEALEMAIQLGADIPKNKRPIVLRMLSLNEKDLIKGLAVWLELLDGKYPNSLEAEVAIKQSQPLLTAKYYHEKQVIEGKEKELKEKTYDLFSASAFYDKLICEKKDVVYYGNKLTVKDSDQVLVRWKTSKNQYRVVFADLTRKTLSSEEMAGLEKNSEQISP